MPDFIVIGAMKAGTTSFQRYLECHPGIAMAPKELNFFSEGLNWNKGFEWYQRHFTATGQVQGEVSPSYSKGHSDPGVAKRIHDAVPCVKIIYVIREPIARIISHLSHAIGEDTGNRSADRILEESLDHFVNTSRYMMQLERYLEYFDSSQILVITSESLRDRRKQTLKQVFRFLNVDDTFSSAAFDQIHHDSSVKVRRNAIGRMFARYPLLRRLEHAAKSGLPRWSYPLFAKVLGTNFSKPALTAQQEAKIVEALQDDVRKLREFTGYSLKEWGWAD